MPRPGQSTEPWYKRSVTDSTFKAVSGSNEVAFSDRVLPGSSGVTRIDHGVLPPDQLDRFTRFVVEALLPELRKRTGYRSLEVFIERATGDVRVVSTWDDSSSRRAAADAFLPVLRHGADFQLRPIAIEEP
jgi:hypothetical protein